MEAMIGSPVVKPEAQASERLSLNNMRKETERSQEREGSQGPADRQIRQPTMAENVGVSMTAYRVQIKARNEEMLY
jgi:hypothetical protein